MEAQTSVILSNVPCLSDSRHELNRMLYWLELAGKTSSFDRALVLKCFDRNMGVMVHLNDEGEFVGIGVAQA